MEEYVIPTMMLMNIEMMDRMQHSMSWKRVSMDGCLIFVYSVKDCFLVSGLVFPQRLARSQSRSALDLAAFAQHATSDRRHHEVPSWKNTLFSAALEANDYSWTMSEVESPVQYRRR
eukprot:scaffold5720_cov92-Skeletonema_dohrnii-CCMP3373.AAC.1